MTRKLQDPVFDVREVIKVHRMGEVEVHSLRDVDLDCSPGDFVVVPPALRKRQDGVRFRAE